MQLERFDVRNSNACFGENWKYLRGEKISVNSFVICGNDDNLSTCKQEYLQFWNKHFEDVYALSTKIVLKRNIFREIYYIMGNIKPVFNSCLSDEITFGDF